MFDLSKSSTTDQERNILRKLRVWIAALAVACLLAGIGIGAMLSGRPAIAQPEISEKDEDKEDQSSTNPLLDMFRRQRRPTRGVGSGFIVNPKGYILTNHHVVEDASRITVGLQSGEKYRGTVIGVDPETDVAVIKIDAPKDLPTVTLGDSNAAQVGDWVLA